MSSGPRPLRWACHLVVGAWLLAFFATFTAAAPQVGQLEPPAEIIARVQPLPEPTESLPAAEPVPEEPAPEPADEPASSPPPEPEAPPKAAADLAARDETEAAPAPTTPVTASDLRRGDGLLGGGDFPVLSCSYESFPSFRAYARAMARLGARFVVVQHREIVGRVDVETGVVRDAGNLAEYSPRARDYTAEPGLTFIARAMRERFGASAVVMMLVPRSVDAGLFGGIARVFRGRGESHDDYREIRGRYERSGDSVRLRVESALRRDGRRVALDLLFDLSDIVDRGAPA